MNKRLITKVLSCAMLVSLFNVPLIAKAETTDSIGTTYYVSTINGNDRNDGTSENEAFYSLEKINEINLQPGDKVLLEADSVFTNDYLHIKGSGSEEAPIVIDRYGEGADPRIDTNGQGVWYQDYGTALDNPSHKYEGYVSSSILLYDVEYIEINNLEITNEAPEIETRYNNIDTMNRTGVAVVSQNNGTIDHIHLNGLNIHDVIGNVYDKHMNNGGIYFTVFKPENEEKTGLSRYNDILIENCIVNNVNRWGIAVGYTAYYSQFKTAELPDEVMLKYGMTDVVIRNNYVKDAGGDAITTMYCYRPLIEYNVSDGVAKQINDTDYSETAFGKVAAAIWPWKCKDAVFQYNEAFDTCYNQDGQAWDADWGDGAIYQYNYSHNNAGGAVMICGAEAVNSVFRYNISEDDLEGILNIPGNPSAHFYNNTFYIKEGVPFIRPSMTGGEAIVENNIIYYQGENKEENWTNNSKVTYSNNLYYNYSNAPESDKFAVKADPMLENPGSGPDAISNVSNKITKVDEKEVVTLNEDGNITHDLSVYNGYKLKSNSPAINKGKFIANNGGKDYFGNKVAGTPDIGAHETGTQDLGLYSSVYTVDEVNKSINGVKSNTTVEKLLANLSYNSAIKVNNADGSELKATDKVENGSKVVITVGEKTNEYTVQDIIPSEEVKETEVNGIEASIYMIDEEKNEIYLPILNNNPTTVEEVLSGLTAKDSYSIKVFNDGSEFKSGNVQAGMLVKVIAEDGSEAQYKIVQKNDYNWALDYTGKQGNLWFAQSKINGEYTNLNKYNEIYPQWDGEVYAGVGVDEQTHSAAITEETHGLLIDAMEDGDTQGHSMAFRAPKTGTVTISVKDGEPYLRQDGNENGSVKLSITHNGAEKDSVTLDTSNKQVALDKITIKVTKGDYIRIEAINIDNPTKPSVHVTPIITYQDVAVNN